MAKSGRGNKKSNPHTINVEVIPTNDQPPRVVVNKPLHVWTGRSCLVLSLLVILLVCQLKIRVPVMILRSKQESRNVSDCNKPNYKKKKKNCCSCARQV